ncbi:MAG: NYN domain-containing protein [bacterium]|nr:NYN domain-containing protein [bacterium]
MISQFIKGKVYVFIDAENLFYAQRTLGWRISYEKLMKYFKRECGEEVKCFVYKGVDEFNLGQKRFLDMLDIAGYILRAKVVKRIKERGGREHWKGNLDIELAFEMVDTKDKYDTAILISGDSDFAAPVDRIKQAGKRIIILSTRGHISRELLDRAKYIDLRKLKNELAQENKQA